jgi:hypothetical protein
MMTHGCSHSVVDSIHAIRPWNSERTATCEGPILKRRVARSEAVLEPIA